MNDAGIIALYWQRSERAIPETENAYGPYCHTVAYNLLRNAEDAEESVNDTWLAAWNAMPPERPNSLKAFLGRITRNISVTRLRRSGSQKRGGGEAKHSRDNALRTIKEETPWQHPPRPGRTSSPGITVTFI